MHRILIIDDHPIFRHAMITILGKKFPDSETLEANSISEALTLLEQDAKFDLIMLDLNMPETCGLNGLLEIRNQHPNALFQKAAKLKKLPHLSKVFLKGTCVYHQRY